MNRSFTARLAFGRSMMSRGGWFRVCSAGAIARLLTISMMLPDLSFPILTLLTDAGGRAGVAGVAVEDAGTAVVVGGTCGMDCGACGTGVAGVWTGVVFGWVGAGIAP